MKHLLTEADAASKRCCAAPTMQCVASACIAWRFEEVMGQSKTIDLPPQIAADFNACNREAHAARVAVEGADDMDQVAAVEEANPIDDSMIHAWIAKVLAALAPEGWRLSNNDLDVDQELADWFEGGWLDGELEAGSITLRFERAPPGAEPRGTCSKLPRIYG